MHRIIHIQSVLFLCAALLVVVGCGQNNGASLKLDPIAQQLLDEGTRSLEAGALHDALAFADSAIAVQPEAAAVYFLRGRVLLRSTRIEEAEKAFEEALNQNPEHADAWFNLGNISFMNRSYSDAIQRYQKEQDVVERQLDKFGTAYSVRYGETMSRLAVQIGRAHRQLAQDEQAIAAFEEAIAYDKTNADAYADLSQSLKDAGRTDDALSYAERALAMAPAHPDYNYQVGALMQELGKPNKAVPLLQQSLNLKPWLSAARYSLGLALVELGEEEAGELQLQLADTLQALNDRVEKARFEAQTFPTQIARWLTLGRLLIQAGRVDEAAEPFAVAASLQPNNLAIRNDIANLSLIRGDTLDAIRRLDQLLIEQPDFADGWYNLGVIYALRGAYAPAEKAWQKTLNLNPAHAEAKQNLEQLASR